MAVCTGNGAVHGARQRAYGGDNDARRDSRETESGNGDTGCDDVYSSGHSGGDDVHKDTGKISDGGEEARCGHAAACGSHTDSGSTGHELRGGMEQRDSAA